MPLLVAHAVVVACPSRLSRDVSPDQQPHQIRSASSRPASGGRRGRNPSSPLYFLRPYHRMEEKFTNPSSLYKYMADPLASLRLEGLGGGAESGEGEPIHCFTKWVFWVLMAN